MPRPNRPRSIASEQSLARRIAHERESRRMSYEGLASRLSSAGCPIQASAIYKIEKANPPRRITVDELVAFSQVFGVSVEQLLLPPEVVASRELAELVIAWDNARLKAADTRQSERDAWTSLQSFVERHAEAADSLESFMRTWVEHYFPDHHDEALAGWMHQVTGSPEWGQRFADVFRYGKDES